jgi:alanine racemase
MLARQLDRAAGTAGKKVRVHLKVDTGMGRLGVLPGEMDDFLDGFASCSNLILDAVYTHFPVADCDSRFTREQLEMLRSLLDKLRGRGYEVPNVHVANSAALLNRCGETFGIVRPGISIYGLYGSPLASREINLEEVVSFKARVVHVKKVPSGTSVSYGREFIALRDTTIVTIAAGYADGVPFRLAKKGDVLIHGRRFPIVGRVTMDMTMADVGESNDIAVGDVAVFFGGSGREHISVSEVAEKSGTIEHEVICGIGPRVPRVYLRDGHVACIQRYTFG